MKIYVIGSGAIGSLFAAYLDKGGMDVNLVARNDKVASAIENHGLKISGRRGDHIVRLPVLMQAPEDSDADLVLLCVKSYDTAGAAKQHESLFKSAKMIVSLQNGIGNVEELAARFGEDKVLAGSTTMGAFVVGPGAVNHAGEGETMIGEPRGGISSRTQSTADAFCAAGVPTVASDNINEALWMKLCVNVAINALCALLRIRNGVTAQYESTRAIMLSAVAEAVTVAGRLGIALDLDEMNNRVIEVAKNTARNRSSMLTDVLNDRRTEINFINGAVARLGRENNIEVPVNDLLTNFVVALHDTRSCRVDMEQA